MVIDVSNIRLREGASADSLGSAKPVDHQAGRKVNSAPRAALEPRHFLRMAQAGLFVSILMLSLAPLAVPDDYSVVDHILSEAGAQGVDGAWVFRAAILLTAVSVFSLVSMSDKVWSRRARQLLRLYAGGLVFLAIFPEAPWNGGVHNALVAWLHTAAGVVGAVAFILAAFTVWRERPPDQGMRRAFDWIVMASIALLPQAMLVLPADGILQRLMVALGYIWLLAESTRIASSITAVKPLAAHGG